MFSYVVDVLRPYVVVFGSSKIPESLLELTWFWGFQQVISRIARTDVATWCYIRLMGISCSRRAVVVNTETVNISVAGGIDAGCVHAVGEPCTTTPLSDPTVSADTGSTSTDTGAATTSRFNKIRGVARARFRCAVRRVIRLLALRKKWAAYGRLLQQEPRCCLFDGLERRKGVLKRVKKLQ